ncbi:hypothetical protein Q1695_002059 [Nippostrongylus brasiliensis]|nr:hypothetical protein Q1695_002059 [Nippostrongylus brasiliensis]
MTCSKILKLLALLQKIDVGRPVPNVEWSDSQGQLITADSDKFRIENVGLSTVLTIKRLRAEDRGEFRLRVWNRCGEDCFPISIQITDRPSAPGRPSVQDQNVDSVRLLWSAPTHDGGSPIRYYTVEMCMARDMKWMKAVTTKQPFVTLFNLAADENYLFRVRADNAVGQSEPSEESESVYVRDVSREIEEPKKRNHDEDEPELINYDRLDAKVDLSEHKPIDINHLPSDLQAKYIICEELGQGAYGTVYRAIEKATGKTWAAKMVKVRPGVKREDVLHEITIMNELNHEKLLNLHEAFDLGNEMCLIEEFVSGGELFEKIMEDDSLMSEQEVRDYMHQILLGLQHMHNNQIVHLDLKPENILLKSKNSTEVKIIDFGLARKLDPKKSVKLLFGTPEFCAPEVVNYQPVGLSTDMWTVGVITYVLLSGLSPFLGDSDEDTLANVSVADWDFDDPSWDDVSDVAKDFICRLMMKDKRRRMTVQEALRHPWITGPLLSAFNDLSEYIKKTQSDETSGPLPSRQKKNFMSLKRWSDDLLPIGRLAKRGAIFRRLTMDGVFERNISFETECAPSVKKQLEDIAANVGDLIATLSCNLAGNPEPHITWFKDNREIVLLSPKYQSRFSEGLSELTVKNIEASDAGKYSCRATNDLGSITTTANLIVTKRKADTSPAELAKRRTTKMDGDDGEIEGCAPLFHHVLTDCSVKIGEQKILCVTNTTLPEPAVQWFHNGYRVYESDAGYLLKHDKGRFELTILSATIEEEGHWRVVGRNAFGECESTCMLSIEIPDGHFAPNFDRPLMDLRCEEGDMMRLCVRISSNPPAKVKWYHNGEELSSDRLKLNEDTFGNYTVTAVSALKTDGGEYKCVATNAVGKAHCSCQVRVGEVLARRAKKVDLTKAPRFRMPLANPREIPEGAELVLTCVVTGVPEPTIVWLKGGHRVSTAACEIRTYEGICTLTIASASLTDAGSYTCLAENVHGSTESVSVVHIVQSLKNQRSAPRFVEMLTNRSVLEHEEIQLECAVVGKPPPAITWYKDGLKLMLENRMLQYTDRRGLTRLNIMNAMSKDTGEYTCEASNSSGKDFTHGQLKVISMSLGPVTPSSSRCPSPCSPVPPRRLSGFTKPVITRPLVDAEVTVGCRELMELEVDGSAPLTVEWYQNEKLLAESRTLRTYFDGRVAFLKIYDARHEHHGKYTCKISNKLGDAECGATLTINDEVSEQVPDMPVFMKKLEDVTVEKLGDSASFNCLLRGHPQPKLCWLHNGRAIHNEDPSYQSHAGSAGDASLNIPSVSDHLLGTYTAVATNPFGDAHSSADLKLQVPNKKVSLTRIVEPRQSRN